MLKVFFFLKKKKPNKGVRMKKLGTSFKIFWVRVQSRK